MTDRIRKVGVATAMGLAAFINVDPAFAEPNESAPSQIEVIGSSDSAKEQRDLAGRMKDYFDGKISETIKLELKELMRRGYTMDDLTSGFAYVMLPTGIELEGTDRQKLEKMIGKSAILYSFDKPKKTDFVSNPLSNPPKGLEDRRVMLPVSYRQAMAKHHQAEITYGQNRVLVIKPEDQHLSPVSLGRDVSYIRLDLSFFSNKLTE